MAYRGLGLFGFLFGGWAPEALDPKPRCMSCGFCALMGVGGFETDLGCRTLTRGLAGGVSDVRPKPSH